MRAVAMISVIATVFLVSFKFVVGWLSNSLGILSDALHSGLDLVAAAITFLAVRVSVRPADVDHQFGHGKFENLGALIETILLFVACAIIIWESLNRLLWTKATVEVSVWAFLVMAVSIVINVTLSRILSRTARKYNSPALEVQALNFYADLFSSAVVLGGLALVWISENTGLTPLLPQLQYIAPEFYLLYTNFNSNILYYADSVAALVVACIIIFVSYRMGRRAADALLDRAPKGISDRVKKVVSETEGVQECTLVRVRPSGPRYWVAVNVSINEADSLKTAHDIALNVEDRIKGILPTAEVVVHTDPAEMKREPITLRVRDIAAINELKVHDVHVHEVEKKEYIDLHLEAPPRLSLKRTHQLADSLEKEIKKRIPKVEEVNIHLEPAEKPRIEYKDITDESKEMKKEIQKVVADMIGDGKCHEIRIREIKDKFYVYIHLTLDKEMTLRKAHDVTSRMEAKIKKRIPKIAEINIHAEPSS
jgi:divalent metal cation (Fe/Co/Zn/Cd) transporter